eukprot:TRINITY_DN6656_c0_g1_i1.p3 TRINITY_DN6656_c0_g1~~TRINITY_DN6656_c0_g1_i1.p3  ORF type:complete len:132 (+),score=31.85 TRINITY_DN6656_c0_g1_i1:210-605(+)
MSFQAGSFGQTVKAKLKRAKGKTISLFSKCIPQRKKEADDQHSLGSLQLEGSETGAVLQVEDMEMEYAGLLNTIDNGMFDVDSTPPVRRPGTMEWSLADSPDPPQRRVCEEVDPTEEESEQPIAKRYADDL